MTGKRIHERYERRIRVEVQNGEESFSAITQNISLGGMFLICEQSAPMGTMLKIKFRLPTLDRDIECSARIRWVRPEGVGLQFDSLRAKEVWALNQFFKQED